MGHPNKHTRKNKGNKTWKKEGEGANEPKPHATGVNVQLPDVSAIGKPGSPCGSFDLCQTSAIGSQQSNPTLETSKNTPDMLASKDDKGVEVEFGDGNPKRGTDTGEVIARLSDKSAAFSDTEVTATEGVGTEMYFASLIKIKAKMERNTKVLERISNFVKPDSDSDEEAPVASNEEEVEWVTGEVHGYKYKVRKEDVEAEERMNHFELLQDICIRQERIAMKLARNRKATAALSGWAKEIQDADFFVPPASMFATPESKPDLRTCMPTTRRAADQTMVVEEELERLLTIREYLKAKQVFHIGSK